MPSCAATLPRRRRVEPNLPDRPSRPPLVSIVVPNRDGEQSLETMLRSFADVNSYQPFEFIVVDNGTKDKKSPDILGEWQRNLPLRRISYEESKSRSFACNRAAEIASGELLLLLDNNVVFEVDVLSRLVAAIELASVGAVGLKLYPGRRLIHGDLPNHIGMRFGWNERRRRVIAYNVPTLQTLISAESAVTRSRL